MKLTGLTLSVLLAPLALAHASPFADEVVEADGLIAVPSLEQSNPISALIGRDLGSVAGVTEDSLIGRAALLDTRATFCPGKSYPNACHHRYCCPGPKYHSCCHEKKIRGCFHQQPQFLSCCKGTGVACDNRHAYCCRSSTGCCKL